MPKTYLAGTALQALHSGEAEVRVGHRLDSGPARGTRRIYIVGTTLDGMASRTSVMWFRPDEAMEVARLLHQHSAEAASE